MSVSYTQAFIQPTATVADLLENLNLTGFRTALVVNDHQQLLGIVTDQDVRKALLQGKTLETTLDTIMNSHPVVGFSHQGRQVLLDILMEHQIETLPVVDDEYRVVDFVRIRDFVQRDRVSIPMVIMAGGFGKRLWPLTENVPKPLLPVGKKPILTHILEHLRHQGFQEIHLTTYYKAELIEEFVASRPVEGLRCKVHREEEPLGTAGAIRAIDFGGYTGPIGVMNGDILTRVQFHDLIHWHQVHENHLTMGTRTYQTQIPFGVIETEGQRVTGLMEKPVYAYNTNAGIYLLEQAALQYIPEGLRYDMTDLIERLVALDQPVGIFPIAEPWIDVGQPTTFQKVSQEYHKYVTNPLP